MMAWPLCRSGTSKAASALSSPAGLRENRPTRTWDERIKIIRTCVKTSRGRVPVIAGTGTNSTELTIAHTASAQSCGADAALIVTPYFNRPSQEGIVRHFEAIADQVKLPIIVYNVPSRTGVDLTMPTLDRLAQILTIVGIKDATGEVKRVEYVRKIFHDRFILLSGHDATCQEFNLSGGDGTISVIANVLPHVFVALHDACRNGDWTTAHYIQQRMQRIFEAFDLDTNPCPIKYALKHRRGMSDEVRLPLVPVSVETAGVIRSALDHLGGLANQTDRAGVIFNPVKPSSEAQTAPLVSQA